MPASATVAALAMGTLGDETHIELILFVQHCPRYLRQVQPLSLLRALLHNFLQKNCYCKLTLFTHTKLANCLSLKIVARQIVVRTKRPTQHSGRTFASSSQGQGFESSFCSSNWERENSKKVSEVTKY
jgi:hypothetical protein